MPAKAIETDVVIAGLGPVGAYLAGLLGRRGLRVLAVERDTEVYPLPRAAHIDHEVMRLLDLVGVSKAVTDTSGNMSSYDFVTAEGEILMRFGFPSELAPTGFAWSVLFYQPALEHALRDDLDGIDGVETRLGVEMSGYETDGDGVTVTLKDADGEESTVRCAYLVGCDGARSTVRRIAGIGLEDLGFEEPWLVIDVEFHDKKRRLGDVSRQHCDPKRPVTSIPFCEGRHRWEFMLMPGETAEDISKPERIEELIRPYADPASLTVIRSAVYRFHGIVADKWHDGRILLAGDAAHQMPPFMGQGLCSGVRDAANLAWKLAAVLKGEASPALLDSVQPEREPQVRFITEAAIGMGRTVCTHDPKEAEARDREMLAIPFEERCSSNPPVLPVPGGHMGGEAGGHILPSLGVELERAAGYGPVLLLREGEAAGNSVAGAFVIALSDPGLPPQTRAIAEQLMGSSCALLARPDRIIFGTGTPASLASAWHDYLNSGAIAEAA